MSIGVLGDITFEVSKDKVRTWNEASRSGDARWHQHDVFAGRPVQEFIGPGLDRIRMSVRLDLERGVIPRDELRKMREHRDKGEVLQFTIGSELVGDFVIKNLNEEWRRFSRAGVLTTAVVSLDLEQYE